LSSLGDSVFVFATQHGELTGYYHSFDFGPAFNGVSFGRHRTSDGREEFVAQRHSTLGAANAGPQVGPVVVSQIMYQPPASAGTNNTTDEFIALRNVSAQPVSLFDPAHPTNTWRLRGAVELDLPPHVSLTAGETLVCVSFNPELDLGALARFRTRYNLPPTWRVLGPWRGHLDNAGDEVRLLQPDTPQAPPATDPGYVPYVLVERVAYRGGHPWPREARGSGLALTRHDLFAFANDPAHWVAASPNPDLPDADRDGLPDPWERSHGLRPDTADGDHGPAGDPDGDGASNLQEYLSGTRPRDAGDHLRLSGVASAPDLVVLTFTAQPGIAYTLLSRDTLSADTWVSRAAFTPVTVPTLQTFQEPLPPTARLYQLRVP